MEIFIGFLLLVVGGIVFMAFKFMQDDDKRAKTLEDAKGKRITDLETEVGQKDGELKKALAEVQRIEEEFYKAKDEADIAKKDVSELQAKLKSLEKDRDEVVELKNDLKQKEQLLQQETLARQKLQGELSLKDSEIEKKAKEAEQFLKESQKAATDLKDAAKMLEGLKGQYNELEAELQKVKMAQVQEASKPALREVEGASEQPGIDGVSKTSGASMASKAPESPKMDEAPEVPVVPKTVESVKTPESPKTDETSEASRASKAAEIVKTPEPPKPSAPFKAAKPHESFEPIEPPKPQPPPSAEVRINQGFGFTKAELRQGVPSDTDFLKANPPPKPVEASPEIPDGAFKLTNVNRPQPSAPTEEKKDKAKTKRETLIPGFQPNDKNPPETP